MSVEDERRAFDNIPLGVTEDLQDILFERHMEKQSKPTANHDLISKAPTSKRRARVLRDIRDLQYAREDAAIEEDHL